MAPFSGVLRSRVRLSPSLEFLREFSSFFTNKLSKTPDLEVIRHKVKIPIEAEDIQGHLDRAPLAAGSEYLRTEVLEDLWSRLNRTFCRAIQPYEGTVEDFVRAYSPDIHLVGRVFFHLVENKNSNFPFAYMATYSTRLNQKGRSKHLPLKHALEEYGNDDKKLLELLSTVHGAAIMSYWRYLRYVSVVEKRAKAARKLEQLRKKNPDIRPIVIEGRAIARTWWGKSWNLNLERYADYSNRIGRGRTYMRHGAVLDLRIKTGKAESLVQGSRARPYTVTVKIKPIKNMCKHVAATLYGIRARLDQDPGLFFSLRKVAIKDLVARAVKDESQKLLTKAEKKSKRVIAESDTEFYHQGQKAGKDQEQGKGGLYLIRVVGAGSIAVRHFGISF